MLNFELDNKHVTCILLAWIDGALQKIRRLESANFDGVIQPVSRGREQLEKVKRLDGEKSNRSVSLKKVGKKLLGPCHASSLSSDRDDSSRIQIFMVAIQ